MADNLSITDRMRAASLLDVLFGDEETFDPLLARELITLIPSQEPPSLRIRFSMEERDEGIQGKTSQTGQTYLEGENEERVLVQHNQLTEYRIGVFKVTHQRGCLYVTGLWGHTGGGYEAAAAIRYTGFEPDEIYFTQPALYEFGGTRLTMGERLWKKPVGVDVLSTQVQEQLRFLAPDRMALFVMIGAGTLIIVTGLVVRLLVFLITGH